MGGDDVRVLREVLAVFQFPLEIGACGTRFADGLNGDSLACRSIVGNPGSAVRALAGLLHEGESLVQACLVGGGRFACHCCC